MVLVARLYGKATSGGGSFLRSCRQMAQGETTLLDAPPDSETLTDYDHAHMVLYLRIFDAAEEGADWQEVVEVLFGLDPKHDPDRCRNVYDSHLARARWMTEHGYRDLLRQGGDGPNG